MGLFKKKERVLDLTEYHAKRQIAPQEDSVVDLSSPSSSSASEVSPFGGFFGGNVPSASPEPVATSYSESPNSEGADERRRRLASRLKQMTDKLEDISNQIYHLQQRIEVLERKSGSEY